MGCGFSCGVGPPSHLKGVLSFVSPILPAFQIKLLFLASTPFLLIIGLSCSEQTQLGFSIKNKTLKKEPEIVKSSGKFAQHISS